MQAVILCAGVGSRLRPLTDLVPKCLVKVGGKPILKWQLTALLENNIKDIVVVVGYKGEQVRHFIEAHFSEFAIQIINNNEYGATNNMYSLYLAEQYVKGDFVLLNGDVVFDASIVKALMESSYRDAIAVDTSVFNEESMKIIIERGLIVDISKQIPRERASGVSIDLYKFSDRGRQRLFQEVRRIVEGKGDRNQWTEVAIQQMLKAGMQMHPVEIGGKAWIEIDDYKDLEQAEMLFNPKARALRTKEVFFLDGDGTMYTGDKPLPGAIELTKWLRDQQKVFCLLSNNSSRSKKEYVAKLGAMGLEIKEDEIITSTDLTVQYLKKEGYRSVYALGTPSFERELLENGIDVVQENPQAVVLGFDKTLTYMKIKTAALLIQKGVPFIATHADKVCPTQEGFVPDAGAIIELLKSATGASPVVLGKPNKDMVLGKLREIGISPAQAVIIGDRLYTDILMGQEAGIDTVCVLSGETTWDKVETSEIKPDIVLMNLKSVWELLRNEDFRLK